MKIEFLDRDVCSTYTLNIKHVKVYTCEYGVKVYIDSDVFNDLISIVDEAQQKDNGFDNQDECLSLEGDHEFRELIIFMLSIGEYDPRACGSTVILHDEKTKIWWRLVDLGIIILHEKDREVSDAR